ncbi:MAG: KUP/HAK/KT family potassium transporter [Acidimicrobiia bacterium]
MTSRPPTRTAVLGLAALGIVFGDIGTSPLYAINEVFYRSHALHRNHDDVLGAISLVVWTLVVVVTIKYVVVVLRADYEGEGGVFALLAQIRRHRTRFVVIVGGLLVVAAGLLFGDGMITPAISVLSAVEGLQVATPVFRSSVIPITIAVLIAVFLVQSRGTHRVGALFGPIMLVWFVVIALLGLRQISHTPDILHAWNPMYGLRTITSVSLRHLTALLGGVVLVVTGGEALFADLGHFGRRPIRLSWSAIVFPALLLSYLGQGAFVLSGHDRTQGSLFFSTVPRWGIYPMVVLATLAAVIASQALISAAFSLASQGMALNLIPQMRVIHTHEEHAGQIYVPTVNWALLVGCVLLVLAFRSSASLASAYGLAVAGVMVATTLAVIAVARHEWRWPRAVVLLSLAPLLAIDASFLVANSAKLFAGGWVPVTVGLVLFVVMMTWRWGRRQVSHAFLRLTTLTMRDIMDVKHWAPRTFPRSMIVLTIQHPRDLDDACPPILELFYRRFEQLPKHLILLTIRQVRRPYVPRERRYDVEVFENDRERDASLLSIAATFGFMESPDVEQVIADIAANDALTPGDDLSDWIIHAGKERVVMGDDQGFAARMRFGLFKALARNAEPSYYYFGLGEDTRLTVEYLPVKL